MLTAPTAPIVGGQDQDKFEWSKPIHDKFSVLKFIYTPFYSKVLLLDI